MGKLLEELKRRKVFRVTAVYAVVAWVLIQVADTLLPALQMPEWTVSFVTVLLILGFLPTVVAAWAYEITPDGVKPDAVVHPVKGLQATSAQPINYLILVIVLLVAAIQLVNTFRDRSGPTQAINNEIFPSAGTVPVTSVMRSTLILNQSLQSPSFQRVRTQLELTPDGSELIYAKYREGSADSIYVRDLESGVEREVFSGFVGAIHLDPSATQIGAPMTNELRVIGINGSQGPSISAQGLGAPGGWLDDNRFIYTNSPGGLSIFNFDEGTSELIAELQPGLVGGFNAYTNSALLPGGDAILTTAHSLAGVRDSIVLFDLVTRSQKVLITNGYFPTYAQSGHILFIREGDLWAVAFDHEQLLVTSQEVRVIESVNSYSNFNMAALSVSDYGRLIYMEGPEMQLNEVSLYWINRQGEEEFVEIPATQFSDPELHPTRNELALTVSQNGAADIYVYDLQRQTFGRRTFTGSAFNPKWSSDGSQLVFENGFPFGDNSGIFAVNSDGTGQVDIVVPPRADNDRLSPDTFNPVNNQLLYLQGPVGGRNLHSAHFVDGQWVSQDFISQEASTWGASISPDGQWIAYGSNESGQLEVYIRPYPDISGGKWQISNNTGREPKWGPEGDELFYVESSTGSIFSVAIDTSNGIGAGIPQRIVSNIYVDGGNPPSYAVSHDGERFLIMRESETEVEQIIASGQAALTVVENFFEVLNRLVPSE